MIAPYTPGPWRSVPTESGEFYTHQIEVIEGHIASVVGWTQYGVVCPTTEANAKLIEHAPDLAAALRDLLGWEVLSGGWDAPCWKRAEAVLEHATGIRSPHPVVPVRRASDMLADVVPDQGWTEDTQLAVLLDFLDAATARDPVLATRLQAHLQDAISP